MPHSEIPGSTPACGSPRLIAAFHVLRRHLAPRHPPCALPSLISLRIACSLCSFQGTTLLQHEPEPGRDCSLPTAHRSLPSRPGVMSITAPPPTHNPQVLEIEAFIEVAAVESANRGPQPFSQQPTAHRSTSSLPISEPDLLQLSLPTAHSPPLIFSNPQN